MLSQIKTIALIAGTTTLTFGLASVGQAATFSQVVNIDSTTLYPDAANNNPVELFLNAGTYDVTYLTAGEYGAQYSGWKAWSTNPVGCDANGANCSSGYLNIYRISSDELGELNFGNVADRYASAELAAANATDTSFSLTQDALVQFLTPDSPTTDNSGGVSLLVESRDVPEPITGLVLAAGMGGAALRRAKSKKS